MSPLPVVGIQTGDTFVVLPGCASCRPRPHGCSSTLPRVRKLPPATAAATLRTCTANAP